MASIARGLFSVFVADMEMQCTPKHCSYPLSQTPRRGETK
jgi:hypothetical protein